MINPIEDMYSLLMRYEVRVPKEETDLVSDLRYSWKKLKKLSMDVSDTLSRLQVGFKRDLISQVKVFVQDVVQFRTEWEKSGPMVPGLSPMEAYERLRKVRNDDDYYYCSMYFYFIYAALPFFSLIYIAVYRFFSSSFLGQMLIIFLWAVERLPSS